MSELAGRYLAIRDVASLTSLSRATIYRLIKKGDFPSPVRVATQRVAWPERAIHSWLESRISTAPT